MTGDGISKEARIVILSLSASLASQHRGELVQMMSEDIVWQRVYDLADRNRVGPRVFRTLMNVAPTMLPPELMERWQTATRNNLKHNLFLAAELSRVMELLEGHGIRVVSFKGPVLAAMLHDTLALRPFTDLDLLVESAQIAQQAKDILLSEGYRLHEPLTPTQERFYLKTQCEYHLIDPLEQVYIDLHWKVFYSYFSYDFDHADSFSRLVNVSVAGRTYTTFGPEDLLLILSAHSSRHLWETLSMVADFADLIDKFPSLDWAATLSRADALGGRRMLLLAVCLSQTLVRGVVPVEISRSIRRDPLVQHLARDVMSRVCAPTQVLPGFLEELAFHLRCRERLYHRLRFVFLGAFTPGLQEYRRFPLPEPLFPLLFVLRLLRLLSRVLSSPTLD